jgi:hypothetical protein
VVKSRKSKAIVATFGLNYTIAHLCHLLEETFIGKTSTHAEIIYCMNGATSLFTGISLRYAIVYDMQYTI